MAAWPAIGSDGRCRVTAWPGGPDTGTCSGCPTFRATGYENLPGTVLDNSEYWVLAVEARARSKQGLFG